MAAGRGRSAAVGEDRAARVAELSQKLVRLAEMLETAEAKAAEVRQELAGLDLADCLADDFDALVIPSAAAERLQDGLDQLAGELANRSARPKRGKNQISGGVDRAGLLRPPEPATQEELRVRCPSCNRDFTSPVAGDATRLRSQSIDRRTYVCPHCGHEDCYETWDHFVE